MANDGGLLRGTSVGIFRALDAIIGVGDCGSLGAFGGVVLLKGLRPDNRGERKGFERVFVATLRRRRLVSWAIDWESRERLDAGVFVGLAMVILSSESVSTIAMVASVDV